MAAKKHNENIIWGVVLISLGAIFLVQKLFHIEVFEFLWQFWPVLLIIWGISVLRSNSR